jgi:hypothetical protein
MTKTILVRKGTKNEVKVGDVLTAYVPSGACRPCEERKAIAEVKFAVIDPPVESNEDGRIVLLVVGPPPGSDDDGAVGQILYAKTEKVLDNTNTEWLHVEVPDGEETQS